MDKEITIRINYQNGSGLTEAATQIQELRTEAATVPTKWWPDINENILESQKALREIMSSPADYAEDIFNSFTATIEKSLNRVRELVNSYTKKGSMPVNDMYAASMDLAGQVANVRKLLQLQSKGQNFEDVFGFSKNKYSNYAPQLYSRFVEPLLRSSMASASNVMSVQDMVRRVTTDKMFQSTLKSINAQITNEQKEAFTEMMIRQFSPYSALSHTSNIVRNRVSDKNLPFDLEKHALFPQQQLPGGGNNARMTRAYNTRGLDAENYNISESRMIQSIHPKAQRRLINYLTNGEDLEKLMPILREANIMELPGEGSAVYRYNKNMSNRDIDYLAGLAMREYVDAKRSAPIYDSDPTSLLNAGQMIDRQGNRVQLYGNLLHKLYQLFPTVSPTAVKSPSGFSPVYTETDRVAGKLASPDQYYIPKTYIDPTTGTLVSRPYGWKKDLSKGVKERQDDQFVSVSASEITRMLGMTGNNTYGLGRINDETGLPVLGAPKMISVSMKGMLEQIPNNELRVQMTGNEQLRKRYLDLLTTGQSIKYQWGENATDTADYTYAFQNGDNALLVLADEKRRIEKIYRDAHMPSPFNFGNYGPVFDKDAYAASIKQITGEKRLGSSSFALEDVYGVVPKKMRGAIVNLDALYDLYSVFNPKVKNNKRLDGQAWGAPEVFRDDQQMRFATGTSKFMMNALNWRPMFEQVYKYLQEPVSATDSRTKMQEFLDRGYDLSYFFNEDNGKLRVMLPGITTRLKGREHVLEAILRGKYQENGREVTVLDEERRRLAAENLVDIMPENVKYILPESTVKNREAFSYMPEEDFKAVFPQSATEAELKKRKRTNGMIELTASEANEFIGRYGYAYDDKYSGFSTMKSADNMMSSKRFMPESLARAIGLSNEDYERSNELYEEERRKLGTYWGRVQFFSGNERAKQAMHEDPSWVLTSREANSQVESYLKALDLMQTMRRVMLPTENVGMVAGASPGALTAAVLGGLGFDEEQMKAAMGEFGFLLPQIMEANGTVFAPGLEKQIIDLLSRYPSAPGNYLLNLHNEGQSEKFKNAIQKLGRDPSLMSTIFMTPNQLDQLNTGDFDGDTVNAFFNLSDATKKEAEEIKERYMKKSAEIAQQREGLNPAVTKREIAKSLKQEGLAENEAEARAQAIISFLNAQTDMGTASAIIRKAMDAYKSGEVDKDEAMTAIVLGSQSYDRATAAGLKEGKAIDLTELERKYLSRRGESYERFIKHLADSREADEPLGKTLFRASLPSRTSPAGLFSMLQGKNLRGHFDLTSLELMEKWYKDNYSKDAGSMETHAARHYLDMFEKQAIFHAPISEKDIRGAETLRDRWLEQIHAKTVAGRDTKDEYVRYNQYAKRVEEMRSSDALSIPALKAASERMKERYKNTGLSTFINAADEIDRQIAFFENPKNFIQGDFEKARQEIRDKERKEIDAYRINTRNPSPEDRRAYYTSVARNLANEGRIYNWSTMKHWLAKDSQDGMILLGLEEANISNIKNGIQFKDSPGKSIDYARSDYRAKTEASWLDADYNKQRGAESSATKYIGDAMHHAFDAYWKKLAESMISGNPQDAMDATGLVKLFREDILQNGIGASLKSLGYTIEEDQQTGSIVLRGLDGEKLTERIGNLSGKKTVVNGNTSYENSAMANFIEAVNYLAQKNQSGLELYSWEGKRLVRDANGNPTNVEEGFGADAKRFIVRNDKGEIVERYTGIGNEGYQGKYSDRDKYKDYTIEEFQTHAKPDLVFRDKEGKMWIWDYKSSTGGSKESIGQSGFYGDIFEQLAQRYYELEKKKDPTAVNYEKYKDFGHLDSNGNFVSNLGGFLGWDPQTHTLHRRNLLDPVIRKDYEQNKKQYDQAFLAEQADALKGFEEGQTLLEFWLSGKEKATQNIQTATQAAKTWDKSDKVTDFFLSTYAQDKEKLQEISSAIYKEGRSLGLIPEYTPRNRFEMREEQLKQLFKTDTMAAVIKNYGDEEAIKKELRDLEENHMRNIQQNAIQGVAASTIDLENARTDVRNLLLGVKPSGDTSDIMQAFRILNNAKETKNFLMSDERYYENGKWKGVAASQEQEELNRAQEARDREKKYKEATELEKEIEKEFGAGLDKRIEKDISSDKQRISDLLNAKTLSPTELLERKQKEEYESLEKEIAQYKADLEEINKLIADNLKEGKKVDALSKMAEHKKSMVDLLQGFLDNNGLEGKHAGQRALLKAQQDAFDRNIVLQNLMTDTKIAALDRNDAAMRRRQQSRFALTGIQRNMYANLDLRDAYLNKADQARINIQKSENEIKNLEAQKVNKNAEEVRRIDSQIGVEQNKLSLYNKELDEATKGSERLSGASLILNVALQTLGQSLSRFAMQLGRRFFQKAINEAKQFIKQFDASMNEIQMITRKSEGQMNVIRAKTIDKAIGTKTSVSNVSQVEAALYRQGLSDAEVDSRTDAVIKFATVSGTKIADATKILTTALQNGLVSSAQEAMDALVALGDSAATTATDIGKAMQKTAAAAKVAGVSYGELTSMITVMTSSTQLSGNQVGTALNTILSRMRQINTSNYVKDINGETTGVNDIEKALNSAGILLRPEGDDTTIRPATEVLLDIAKRWNSMTDIQKANISTAMAGTRAANMFQSLIEGMAEDNGAEFERLLGLSEDSNGITESKYEIAMTSLNAAMSELKSTFDSLVESFVSSGTVTGFIETITKIVAGLESLSAAGASAAGVISLIVGVLAMGLVSMIPGGAVFAPLVGLLAGGATLGISGSIGNLLKGNDNSLATQNKELIGVTSSYATKTREKANSAQEALDDMKKYYQIMNETSSDSIQHSKAQEQLNASFETLKSILPSVGAEIQSVTDLLENWDKVVNQAQRSIDDFREKSKDRIEYNVRKTMENSLALAYEEEQENNPFVDLNLNNFSVEELKIPKSYAMNDKEKYLEKKMALASFDEGLRNYSQYVRLYNALSPDQQKEFKDIYGDQSTLNKLIKDAPIETLIGTTGIPAEKLKRFQNAIMLYIRNLVPNVPQDERNRLAEALFGEENNQVNGYNMYRGIFESDNNTLRDTFWDYVYHSDYVIPWSNLAEMETDFENGAKDFLSRNENDYEALKDIIYGFFDQFNKEKQNEAFLEFYQNVIKNAVEQNADLLFGDSNNPEIVKSAFLNNLYSQLEYGKKYSVADLSLMYNKERNRYIKTNESQYSQAADKDLLLYTNGLEENGVPIKYATREAALNALMEKESEMSEQEAKKAIKYNDEDAYPTAERIVSDAMLSYRQNNNTYATDLINLLNIARNSDTIGKLNNALGVDPSNLTAILSKYPELLIMWNEMQDAAKNGRDSLFSMEDFTATLNNTIVGGTGNVHAIRSRYLNRVFGEGWQQQMLAGAKPTIQGNVVGTESGNAILDYLGNIEGFTEIVNAINNNEEIDKEKLINFANAFSAEALSNVTAYGDRVQNVVNIFNQLSDTAENAASAINSFNQTANNLASSRLIQTKYANGDRSSDVINQVAEMTNRSAEWVRTVGQTQQGAAYINAAFARQNAISVLQLEDFVNAEMAKRGVQGTNNWTNRGSNIGSLEEWLSMYGSESLRNMLQGINGTVSLNNKGVFTIKIDESSLDDLAVTGEALYSALAESYLADNQTYAEQLRAIAQYGSQATGDFSTLFASNPMLAAMYKEVGAGNGGIVTDNVLQHYALDLMSGRNSFRHSDYASMMSMLFGDALGRNGAYTPSNNAKALLQQTRNNPIGNYFLNNMMSMYDGLADAIDEIETSGKVSADTMEILNDSFSEQAIADMKQYGDRLQQIASIAKQLGGTANDVASAMTNMNKAISDFHDQQQAIQRFNNGNQTSDVYNQVASMTGLPVDWLYANKDNPAVSGMLQMATDASMESVQNYIDSISATLSTNYKGLRFNGINIGLDTLTSWTGLFQDNDQVEAALNIINALTDMGVTGSFSKNSNGVFGLNIDPETLANAFNTTVAQQLDYAYGTYTADNPTWATHARKFLDLRNGTSDVSQWLTNIENDEIAKELFRQYIGGNAEGMKFWGLAKNGSNIFNADDLNAYLTGVANGNDNMTSVMQNMILGRLLGEDWMSQMMNGTWAPSEESMAMYQNILTNEAETAYITELMGTYEDGAEILKMLAGNTEVASTATKNFVNSAVLKGVQATKQYGQNTEQVINYFKQLTGGAQSAAATMKSFNSTLTGVMNNQYYRNKFRSGDRSDETLKVISDLTGFDKDYLKQNGNSSLIENLLNSSEESDTKAIEEYANAAMVSLQNKLKEQAAEVGQDQEFKLGDLTITPGAINTFNLDQVINATRGIVDDTTMQILQILQAFGIEGVVNIEAIGKTIKAWIDITRGSLGGGRKSSSGGGGGGKSVSQKLIDELKQFQEINNHKIKMIQFVETRTENAGEYRNLNTLIAQENELQEELIKSSEEAIDKLLAQMKTVKADSEDWKSLYNAVLSYEEAIEQATNAIADNNKKMKENEATIRKTRMTLEDMVLQEIKNRIQRQRDMLEGTVSMEDIILDAIKQRYQDEWDLIKRDIEQKRQALEEEKSLIDERLNKRKSAEDEAQKYTKLANLKNQLSLVAMDPTRTKDAANLRKEIADIEKELAWSIAEEEADAQKQSLDEQMQGYDDYVKYREEDLNEFLNDATNFTEELNNILGMSQENLIQWLKDNIKQYALSVKEQQQSMVQSWEDTYRQMKGITLTYWDEIEYILSDKNVFLEFMKESQDYLNASDTAMKQMLYEWEKAYDDMVAAILDNIKYVHEELMKYTGTNSSGGGGGGGGKGSTTTAVPTTSTKNVLSDNKNQQTKNNILNTVLPNGSPEKKIVEAIAAAESAKNIRLTPTSVMQGPVNPNAFKNMTQEQKKTAAQIAREKALEEINKNVIPKYKYKYAEGGMVDYTGYAWVDGTKARPESFLDATDTAMIRAMLEAAKYVSTRPYISNIDSSSYTGNNSTVGEVNVTINEAELKDDADFEQVAKNVSEAIVKEISKQGFNTAVYAF